MNTFIYNIKGLFNVRQTAKILIVDDDQDILTAGKLLLKRSFSDVSICSDPAQISGLMKQINYDVILLDMNFGPGESSGKQGLEWLSQILTIDSNMIVVVITAHGGVDLAVEAMKIGATDFVAKPWENEKLVATVRTAVKLGASRSEAEALRQTNKALAAVTNSQNHQSIIAKSSSFNSVLAMLNRAAPTDANVLILGENGTGKELIARELHRKSLRSQNVFMSVDLGALSETLFESELFGYQKGAFTGANETREGRLIAANGGTLFLDEIGNIPLHLQAKLLTILEQRKVTPLGSNKSIPFDVRVISATNLATKDLHDESIFRQDLLFRLNTVELALPALRNRVDDIEPIAQHYLAHYCKKYGKADKELSESARIALKNYHWPGNIRALRHATERAVILSDSTTLEASDFQLVNNLTAQSAQNQNPVEVDRSPAPEVEELNLNRLERATIEKALLKHRYNISHTANELGLTRAALYRRMEKHGL